MSTEINTVSNTQVDVKSTKVDSKKSNLATTSNETAVNKQSDTVSISPISQQISQISESLKGANVVDEAKVAEIKAAIENGSYEIDSMKVAQKFVEIEINHEKAE